MPKLTRLLKRFHDDEYGESSVLTNVMMLAIGALIVIALLAFGRKGMTWLGEQWDNITSG